MQKAISILKSAIKYVGILIVVTEALNVVLKGLETFNPEKSE